MAGKFNLFRILFIFLFALEDIGALYSPKAGMKAYEKQQESMLHVYLSALAVESFAALVILTYAKGKFDSDQLEQYRDFPYRNDIQNILNQQYNPSDSQNSLQYILDHSAFTTEWPNRIEKQKKGGCALIPTPAGVSYCSGHEEWWVWDNYRSRQQVSSSR